jgi:DNA-binding GntR family transcriptional regulator
MHRRILGISRHQVALDVCHRLNSQSLRFQFRTVLAPGRSTKSLETIVDAIVAVNQKAAETAMQRHLSHGTDTLMKVASAERVAS